MFYNSIMALYKFCFIIIIVLQSGKAGVLNSTHSLISPDGETCKRHQQHREDGSHHLHDVWRVGSDVERRRRQNSLRNQRHYVTDHRLLHIAFNKHHSRLDVASQVQVTHTNNRNWRIKILTVFPTSIVKHTHTALCCSTTSQIKISSATVYLTNLAVWSLAAAC